MYFEKDCADDQEQYKYSRSICYNYSCLLRSSSNWSWSFTSFTFLPCPFSPLQVRFNLIYTSSSYMIFHKGPFGMQELGRSLFPIGTGKTFAFQTRLCFYLCLSTKFSVACLCLLAPCLCIATKITKVHPIRHRIDLHTTSNGHRN